MRICILAEGCYPYVPGGVSVWLQNLILNMPQHEFVVLAIGANSSMRGQYRFKLPANLVTLHEVFMDEVTAARGKWGKKYKLDKDEEQFLQKILCEGYFEPELLFGMIKGGKVENTLDFLHSRNFFDTICKVCLEVYPNVPFSDFYWNARSMLLPLFFLLKDGLIPEADLYHSVSAGYAGVLGAVGGWRFNSPFIMTEHGIYTREREEEVVISNWVAPVLKDLWIQFFHCLSRFAYNTAEYVVSLFERNRQFQIQLGCPPEKTCIIPNGVDVKLFEHIPWPSDDTPPTIGAVLRIVPIKDIKTLLYAFAMVKRKIPNARLLIMGSTEEDSEYYQECLNQVKYLELNDVEFSGQVNITKALEQVHVVILTSISEAQPLALLEAMAARRPCISTDVGCCRELLEASDGLGCAGYVAPVMQPKKIADGLMDILSDSEKQKQMGLCGYNRVKTYYPNDKWLIDYRRLYEKMEERHGRHRI